MTENGVDNIKIESELNRLCGFDVYNTGKYDTAQLLRYLLRYQADLKDFKFYAKRYELNQPISCCIPTTRIQRETEFMIIANRKYFPTVTSIDDSLELSACNVIYKHHFVMAFKLKALYTREEKVFSFYLCPFDIIFNTYVRNIFFGLAAAAFAKNKYGVTTIDKNQFFTSIYERNTFNYLKKLNLEQLETEINDKDFKVYYAFTNGVVTLPFMNMYEHLRKAICNTSIVTDEERSLNSDQLYNLRMKKIINGQFMPLLFYQENLIMDLDYCQRCLSYSDPQ